MLTGPQWTQRAHILGENPFFIPITDKLGSLGGSKTSFGCFEAPLELPEPASVGGTTFEGSLKTFLRDLDEVGE